MFHGVPFSSTGGFSLHRALWDTAHPRSLLGPGTQDSSTGHSASGGTTPHVPSPAPAGCPLLPGQSYVTINHKSLSDATSESAQGPGPWDPFPVGPPSVGLSLGSPQECLSLPRQRTGVWACGGTACPLSLSRT